MGEKKWRNLLHVPANLGHQQSGTEKQEAKNPRFGGVNETPNKLRVRKTLGCLAKVGPLSAQSIDGPLKSHWTALDWWAVPL